MKRRCETSKTHSLNDIFFRSFHSVSDSFSFFQSLCFWLFSFHFVSLLCCFHSGPFSLFRNTNEMNRYRPWHLRVNWHVKPYPKPRFWKDMSVPPKTHSLTIWRYIPAILTIRHSALKPNKTVPCSEARLRNYSFCTECSCVNGTRQACQRNTPTGRRVKETHQMDLKEANRRFTVKKMVLQGQKHRPEITKCT